MSTLPQVPRRKAYVYEKPCMCKVFMFRVDDDIASDTYNTLEAARKHLNYCYVTSESDVYLIKVHNCMGLETEEVLEHYSNDWSRDFHSLFSECTVPDGLPFVCDIDTSDVDLNECIVSNTNRTVYRRHRTVHNRMRGTCTCTDMYLYRLPVEPDESDSVFISDVYPNYDAIRNELSNVITDGIQIYRLHTCLDEEGTEEWQNELFDRNE